jgi:hypothetical protein
MPQKMAWPNRRTYSGKTAIVFKTFSNIGKRANLPACQQALIMTGSGRRPGHSSERADAIGIVVGSKE